MRSRAYGSATRWIAPAPLAALVAGLLLAASGCDRLDMYDQPRYEPLEPSHFFRDGLSARPLPEGTVARGELREDEAFYTGKAQGRLVSQIPEAAYRTLYARNRSRFPQAYDEIDASDLRLALLERGRERFNIYCSVCHGETGTGDGMIVRRGFRKPPSYHTERLHNAPAGHFFDVMTNGFGAMVSYASRIEVADRWAIVAYIRALQLSQKAELDDVPADQQPTLMRSSSNSDNDKPASDNAPSDNAARDNATNNNAPSKKAASEDAASENAGGKDARPRQPEEDGR